MVDLKEMNKEFPCICGARNWKQNKLKVYCGNCNFIFFKGFPKGSGKIAICTDRVGHNIDDEY